MPSRSAPPSKPKEFSGGQGSSPAADLELLKSKIADLVQKSPEKAAIILTEWLKQGKSQPNKIKKAG